MTINKEMLIEDVKKIPGLLLGFLICAYGIAQIKVLNFGMAPWDTLVLGIVSKTGLEFGKVTQIMGFIIILFSITIKIYPGIGTILNMTFVGFFVDLISKFNIVLSPENYFLKILVLFYALIVLNYGLYRYLRFGLGAGPRDGLMVGLVQITGLSVKYVRTGLESVVLLVGFLLGGTVGLGTVIATLSGGYVLDKIFSWKNFDPKTTCQRKLSDYVIINKSKIQVKS
ncbi:membrane protein [Alkaliphilus sp. MSJ-5]|uniref:Membrane protein n=1 Tax=Alkaliphilus flagellatus TaxID=2841507 RepID=A0ABS6FZ22_9FIRM|nr:membrane protein [Alkaliphilus flagellatus]MBU5675199.1 membrane protein [Alkaliphilus flagellatus]